MTTAALMPSKEHIENGVTVAFAVPFRFAAASDLIVKRISVAGVVTPLVLNVDYGVTGGQSDAGGTLTVTTPAASGVRLVIERRTPRNQGTQYPTNDTFPAASHEAALDRAMMIDQEQDVAIAEVRARAPMVPFGDTALSFAAGVALAVGSFLSIGAGGVINATSINDFSAAAQAWAESPGAPGGVGTKSAKSWASDSAGAAAAAQASAVTAAAQASIALAATALYDTTAAGLAATSDGQYFYVPVSGAGGVLATLYKNVVGVATLINTALSGSLITYPDQTNFAKSVAFGGGLTKLQVSTYSSEGDYNTFFGIEAGRDLGFGGPWNGNFAFGNTGFGARVMLVATKAYDNSFFGYEAGLNMTEGFNNSGFAPKTLYNNTTGTRNVAFGTTALFSNTTASENSAFGCNSLFYSTGDGNVAAGYGSGWNVTTGVYNVIMGWRACGGNNSAGTAAMSGSYNVALGYRAGYVLTTALDNTLIGRDAAVSLTTGNSNVIIGGTTAQALVTGSSNVFVGNQTGQVYTGSSMVAIGSQALSSNVNAGSLATACGHQSLRLATANGNSAFGYQSGNTVTSGANNSIFGSSAGGVVGGSQNCIFGRAATVGASVNFAAVMGDGATATGDNGIAIGHNSSAGLNAIAIGKGAAAAARTGVIAGQDAAQFALGSATAPVGTQGDGSYYAAAGASQGFMRIVHNGTVRKIQIYADA